MANEEKKPEGAAAANGDANAAKPALNVLAQYVKDLSFESPGAPGSLRARDKAPNIAINVNVNANPLSEKEFDVNLTLSAKASFEKDVLFNVELIYGGGRVGLMGAVADAVQEAGGAVTGIIPDFLMQREVGNTKVDKLEVTDSMHTRKRRMFDLADAFITLSGGLGTLDETIEILTWKQLQLHNKPIVLVNVEGYWDHFVHLVEHQVREGFVRERYLQFFRIVDTVEEVVPALLEDAAAATDQSDRLDRA